MYIKAIQYCFIYNRNRSKYNINKLRVKAQKHQHFGNFGLENKTAIVHFAPTLLKSVNLF